jgi:hypothetical protein
MLPFVVSPHGTVFLHTQGRRGCYRGVIAVFKGQYVERQEHTCATPRLMESEAYDDAARDARALTLQWKSQSEPRQYANPDRNRLDLQD